MAEHSQFQLLRERRFAPFFWTQFLGAGNDNVYKNALVIFVAFQAATYRVFIEPSGQHAPPFLSFLFACVSPEPRPARGQVRNVRSVSSKHSRLRSWSSGHRLPPRPLRLLALGLMGVHSTIFGPVKHAILPQTLRATSWSAVMADRNGHLRRDTPRRNHRRTGDSDQARRPPYAGGPRSPSPSPGTPSAAAFKAPSVAPDLPIDPVCLPGHPGFAR